MKIFLTVLLVAAFITCMPAAAEAQGNVQSIIPNQIITPMYVYFTAANCSLTISGSGVANMTASAQCIPSVSKIRIAAYLQKYSGGSWQNIDSWSQYYYTYTASWSDSVSVTSGYNYRLYVYFYAYNGTLLAETVTRSDTYEY